ncbi:MAG: MFS transporter [Anaerolineae bacterium]|jgi:predicted MFS family arabinose efflux permease|nr:MFS transporter [Anaerolineae bacterium]
MKRLSRHLRFDATIWTSSLIFLAASSFMQRFGQGLLDAASTNFFVETLGLSGNQVLWLEGIREIPGLVLIFIAALTMRLPLSYRTAVSLVIAGVGYGLYATVNSYTGLLVVAVLASLGLHMWMPLNSSLALSLSPKGRTGTVMGTLNGVGSLAAIVGMGALALISWIAGETPLTVYYFAGAALFVVAGLLILRVPPTAGATDEVPPRMLLKGRYWLYYVLTFFQGSRKQVLNTFGTLVLVQTYKLEVHQIGLILMVSSVINLLGSPYLGRLLDRYGERPVLSTSYALLVLSCIGFATSNSVGFLILLLLIIKLLVVLEIGLDTYVYRFAPPEELTPTLSAGISINHVTSVAMPLVAGMLLPIIGYPGIFFGTAGLILLSIPFALSMHPHQQPAPQAAVAVGD